tara:strand:+ start:356 stop:580 length:225 start_codon:yes stop_codon:yes gene_type:complete
MGISRTKEDVKNSEVVRKSKEIFSDQLYVDDKFRYLSVLGTVKKIDKSTRGVIVTTEHGEIEIGENFLVELIVG